MPSILTGPYVISRLRAIMPEQETVNLYSLQSGGTYATPVPWTAKREELSLDEKVMAGVDGNQYGIAFSFFQDIYTAVITLTVVGTITGTGNASCVITASGMTGSPITLAVAVTSGDTASVVATAVRAAINASVNAAAFWTVSGAGAEVILTQKISAVPDTTMALTLDNGTCTGLTAATGVKTQTDPTPPRTDDKIVDAVGVTWTVGNVSPTKLFKKVHRAACIKNY